MENISNVYGWKGISTLNISVGKRIKDSKREFTGETEIGMKCMKTFVTNKNT